MAKILNLNKLLKELAPLRKKKKIGLVTGCFDVLHIGHIEFLKYAKERVDVLVVGVDGDTAIQLSKGAGRPINKHHERCVLLAELVSVDYILPMNSRHHFSSPEANKYYDRITTLLGPHYMFVVVNNDAFRAKRTARANKVGAELIEFRKKHIRSSTNIINRVIKADL